jgi:quercetin dioxygenase-like cupin family protein
MNYDTLISHASVLANQLSLPEGKKMVFGGVEMLRFDIPAGTLLVAHCHDYGHLSILASGKVELWTADNKLQVLEGPVEVQIPAKSKHAIQSLTDAVWYCLHKEDN